MDLNKIYYKILRENLTHHGFTYKIGENKDVHEFNTNECSKGGLYFTDYEFLHNYIEYGPKMAKIKLYPDSKVSREDGEYKTDKFEILEITDIPEEIYLNAVQQDGYALTYVKEQTPEICLAAVKQNGHIIRYVEERTPEIYLAAVQQTGYALQCIEEQTPEICLAAVKQNGYSLQYVEEQTPEICLAAVKQNGYALQYVKNQTLEICLAAIEQNENSFKFVNKKISISTWKMLCEIKNLLKM
jgi:hypothetical protein